MTLSEYLDHHFIDLYLTPDTGDDGLTSFSSSGLVTDDQLVHILRKSLPKAQVMFEEQRSLLEEKERVAEQTLAFNPEDKAHELALENSLSHLDSLEEVAKKASEQLESRASSQKSLRLLKEQLAELTEKLQSQQLVISYLKRLQVYQILQQVKTKAEASRAATVLQALKQLAEIEEEFRQASKIYTVSREDERQRFPHSLGPATPALRLTTALDAAVKEAAEETRDYLGKRVLNVLKQKGWMKNDQRKAEVVLLCEDYSRTVVALANGQATVQWEPLEMSAALVDPFIKHVEQRFRYHFSGSRKTNQVDKPEWFLAYALEQLSEHEGFLRETLAEGLGKLVNQKLYLFEGFVEQVLERCIFWRLERSYNTYSSSDMLFCHVIDELISFGMDLRETLRLDFVSMNTNPLDFITKDKERLKRWVQADFVNAMKQVETILSSDNAWHCGLATDSTGGLEEKRSASHFIPESCVEILALVKKCGTRFLDNLEPAESVTFVFNVQLSILSTYRLAVQDKMQSVTSDNVIPRCIGLNVLCKLSQVLEEWSHSVKYARVYQYQHQTESTIIQSRLDMLGETAGKSKALVQGSTKRFTALLSAAMRMQSGSASPEAAPSRTGVFAAEVTEIESLSERTIDLWSSQLYDKFEEVWRFDAPVEAVNHSLASVRAHLVELKQCLLPEVADRLVKLLAARISALVISSTIETRKFTDSEARQLDRNCTALFETFALFSRKPANRFFRTLKEMVSVLALPRAKLLTLEEALRSLGSTPAENVQAQSLLEDGYQLATLSREQVLTLSLQRIP